MAFNYSKLRGRIIEKFGTQGCFSKAVGVSERTLSLKLNNKIFFSQDEISRMSELLEITSDKIQFYFLRKKFKVLNKTIKKEDKLNG
ncbi:DUF739 family protein [Clostridium sp. C2-6-12]|uniref:DUF739 family protein n=1 Tax=Clostridium sp. C2-6-12 TaxID=2698832 RepID=UPI00136A0148|nr:DUF739 family protein [Clostridium sp. C2-6-12]